jgi:hypothetical protein
MSELSRGLADQPGNPPTLDQIYALYGTREGSTLTSEESIISRADPKVVVRAVDIARKAARSLSDAKPAYQTYGLSEGSASLIMSLTFIQDISDEELLTFDFVSRAEAVTEQQKKFGAQAGLTETAQNIPVENAKRGFFRRNNKTLTAEVVQDERINRLTKTAAELTIRRRIAVAALGGLISMAAIAGAVSALDYNAMNGANDTSQTEPIYTPPATGADQQTEPAYTPSGTENNQQIPTVSYGDFVEEDAGDLAEKGTAVGLVIAGLAMGISGGDQRFYIAHTIASRKYSETTDGQ